MKTSNIEDVIKWMEINGIEFWKVSNSRSDKNGIIFYAEDDEENYLDKLKRFRDFMAVALPGEYYVSGRPKKKQTVGIHEYRLIVTDDKNANIPAMNGIAQIPSDYISKSEIAGMVTEAIEKERTKMEMETLRRRNSELEKENKELDNPFNRILGRFEPMIGMIMNNYLPKPKQIALGTVEPVIDQPEDTQENTPDEFTEDMQTEMNQRVQNAILKWYDADSEFIETLEFIADFASGEKVLSALPMDYKTIKSYLK